MSTPVEFNLTVPHVMPDDSSHQSTNYQFHVELKDAKGPINALTFSKDAKLLLSAGDDGSVRIYNTTTFTCDQVLRSTNWGQVTALSWLVVEPPVDEEAVAVCVGTGRGVITLCPMSKSSTWLIWKESQTVTPFVFNDAVAGQAYDPLHCRLAVASQSGVMKVYSVEKCVNLTPLWTTSMEGAIPRGLNFFGGDNQYLLSLGLETGEMICRDAQTSNIQWRKNLLGGVGHAALSPDETTLLVDNITTGVFDLYKFPSSTPSNSLPFSSTRRFTKQCTFSEAGKVSVCGSDHGTVYLNDVATGESLQALRNTGAFDLMQVVAAAPLNDGHLIAAGTSAVAGRVYIWEKRPPVVERPTAIAARTEPKITKQGLINTLFIVLLVFATYPNWAPPIMKFIAPKSSSMDHPIPVMHGTNFVAPHALKVQEEKI
ncbi:WD40-repeat-containing domain protein [Lyophyllum atratum]|nr:WD40-repeat-containing domain protein [Lyophyllum atratum]